LNAALEIVLLSFSKQNTMAQATKGLAMEEMNMSVRRDLIGARKTQSMTI
jgi:hypothetical protein